MALPETPSATIRVADLPKAKPFRFDLRPTREDLDTLRADLGLVGLRKVRFRGEIAPEGRKDWGLNATLGATVVQECVVTLAPVTTRLDVPVERHFVADWQDPEGDEVEMPEDDSVEPLESEIDLARVLAEALALSLPLYPRAEGAEVDVSTFTEPGKTAMTDEDARPFGQLSELRDKLREEGQK